MSGQAWGTGEDACATKDMPVREDVVDPNKRHFSGIVPADRIGERLRMDGLPAELSRRHDVGKLLGYLNFSDGRPDPRFRRSLAEAFGTLLERSDAAPWTTLGLWLTASCNELAAGGSAAFKDTTQARAVI